ncbi:MAG: hypothetical protein IJ151_07185 [Bacteroidales bacterium]|nr:hypothetical protein [Bacteroidales bacterium]
MAYRYDEKTGEFIGSPESKKEPQKEIYGRTTYPQTTRTTTNTANTTESVAGGCLKLVGKLLLYWAILGGLAAICSLFN